MKNIKCGSVFIVCILFLGCTTATPPNNDSVAPSINDSVDQDNFIPKKEDIIKAQKVLNLFGYNAGTVDGICGKRTAAAISKFQQDKGLPVTAQLDNETMNVLGCNHPGKEVDNSNERSDIFKNIGRALQDMSGVMRKFGDNAGGKDSFVGEVSHAAADVHEGVGTGVVETPKEEGIPGMFKNATTGAWNKLFGEDK